MDRNRPLVLRCLLVLLLASVGVYLSYLILKDKEKLPIYNPSEISPKLVDYSMRWIRKNHKISDFRLINQNNETITNDNFKSKIYVADFFFTTCPTICKEMTKHFKYLQKVFRDDDELMFLSHTVFPENDSVPVLKAYALEHNVNDAKWHLATGDKRHIYELARKSYFAVVDGGGDGGEYDFIHTENFILVDKKRQIRGYYDGTNMEEIRKLVRDIEILKRE